MKKRKDNKPRGEYVDVLYGTFFKRAKVQSLLSVQFTAIWQDGTDTLCFLFYNDKGETWRDSRDD